jgi:3-oxoadipate enol-lactonase
MLVNIEDRNLRYDIVGDELGSVVCMAHCLSFDSGVWAEQVAPLVSNGFRVLRLDMRGHGGSDPGPEDCTMSDLARDVAGALDFLQIPEVHFVGVSIGGMIGQAFGIEHGHRARSLMLCGTAPAALEGGIEYLWRPRFEAIAKAGSLEPLADATINRWMTETFREHRPVRWRQIHETICRTSLAGYRAGALAINSFDALPMLHTVTAPTLVICGDEDTGTPPVGNKRIADLIRGARYQVLSRARHLPMVEYPQLFSGILLDWLASNE